MAIGRASSSAALQPRRGPGRPVWSSRISLRGPGAEAGRSLRKNPTGAIPRAPGPPKAAIGGRCCTRRAEPPRAAVAMNRLFSMSGQPGSGVPRVRNHELDTDHICDCAVALVLVAISVGRGRAENGDHNDRWSFPDDHMPGHQETVRIPYAVSSKRALFGPRRQKIGINVSVGQKTCGWERRTLGVKGSDENEIHASGMRREIRLQWLP